MGEREEKVKNAEKRRLALEQARRDELARLAREDFARCPPLPPHFR